MFPISILMLDICVDNTSKGSEPETMSLTIAVWGTINYCLIMTLGNLFHYGIIHFERHGGDPKKRCVGNQIISFACSMCILHTIVTGSILTLHIWIGSLGSIVATISIFARIVTGLSLCLSIVEHILYKCFMVFHFRIAVNINDDFAASFLALANVISTVIIAASHIILGNVHGRTYTYLSGDQGFPNNK